MKFFILDIVNEQIKKYVLYMFTKLYIIITINNSSLDKNNMKFIIDCNFDLGKMIEKIFEDLELKYLLNNYMNLMWNISKKNEDIKIMKNKNQYEINLSFGLTELSIFYSLTYTIFLLNNIINLILCNYVNKEFFFYN